MDGRILEFDIDKQRLTRKRDCDFSGLVAGSVGYLKVKFNFSAEWDGCAKVVDFKTAEEKPYPVKLDEDNTCKVPPEVLKGDRFYVSVIGGKRDYRIRTNTIRVKQELT